MMGPATDFTPDELMVSALAHTLRDGERVMHGVASMIPVIAIQLARATHAPGLICVNLEGIDARPSRYALTTEYFALAEGATKTSNLLRLFEYAQRGLIDAAFFSGAQIDRLGNVNTSAIGEDYERPKVRLTGGAGQAILCHTVGRIIIWLPRHERNRLPESVDFITLPGHHPNVKRRMDRVVTNLAVMDFEPQSGAMRLVSIHPGVTIEEIQDNTGFDLILPDTIPTTKPPTGEEITLLRTRVDPQGIRKQGM
ncbi:MAG: CoA-transferase [Chloroflexi bacterium]|nr:CoA-transferase [Chloroflexota bacterium]